MNRIMEIEIVRHHYADGEFIEYAIEVDGQPTTGLAVDSLIEVDAVCRGLTWMAAREGRQIQVHTRDEYSK